MPQYMKDIYLQYLPQKDLSSAFNISVELCWKILSSNFVNHDDHELFFYYQSRTMNSSF